MLRLNRKERRLLYALDLNCRQNLKGLAQISGFTQSFVQQKMKQFEAEGIIRGYRVLIDYTALGRLMYRVTLWFSQMAPEEHSRVVEHLEEQREIVHISLLDRDFGISVLFQPGSDEALGRLISGIQDRFGRMLSQHDIHRVDSDIVYPRAYLLGKAADDSGRIFQTGQCEAATDEKDREILRILSRDSRTSVVEISRATGIPPKTVQFRIRRMEEKLIILGYRADIDRDLVGYSTFKVFVETTGTVSDVREYARINPNIIGLEERNPLDFTLTVEAESIGALMGIIRSISERFSPLKRYSYSYIVEERKKGVFIPG
ncbi:Lrp/AsnC family transcriptional regulator [Candidatus Woesearchaeota archaeon]|nr:Lrp/AsnC family transcriptional regulator [Candidatus Woesearchaeota archaeon]